MMNLAIRGNEARAGEIIELFINMNPNVCTNGYNGSNPRMVYVLDGDKITEIPYSKCISNYNIHVFELKKFLDKYPYRLGDVIKTIWGNVGKITDKRWDVDLDTVVYKLINNDRWYKSDDIFMYDEDVESNVKSSESAKIIIEPIQVQDEDKDDLTDKAKAPTLIGMDYSGERYGYKMPKDYELDEIENGVIYFKPIKHVQYPKTYEECCYMLGLDPDQDLMYYLDIDQTSYEYDQMKIMRSLRKLLICRHAYWKILNPSKTLHNGRLDSVDKLTTFPDDKVTKEFRTNFEDLIENCNESI